MIRGAAQEERLDEIFERAEEISFMEDSVFPGITRETGALLLAGESGSGKSALLKAAAAQASRHDFRVLRCAGSRAERNLEYGALHQLLKPILDLLPAVPASLRSALCGAFGVRRAGQQSATAETDAGHDRFLVGLACLNLLLAAARRRPVMVVVDDLQELDACSRDALLFVARRIADEPMGVLAAAPGDSRAAAR
ncbi:ATP-binding protein [Streptomyces carpinensis]|uniref:ATP-binding protein n=1 Tax=Streptomyces carpinensis TaxID=66369 RepID=UPI001FCA0770|nr:ATP-binding protein [Streptomyces carpinensis]